MPIIGDAATFDPTWLLQYRAAAVFGVNHWARIPPGGTVDAEFVWTTARTKRKACDVATSGNGVAVGATR